MVKEAIAITENDMVADIIIDHYLKQRAKSITVQYIDSRWWLILLAKDEFRMILKQPFLLITSPYRNLIALNAPPDNSRFIIH